MDEKISLKAIDQYATQFANRVADAFFASHEKITGPEILSLSEIKQVNLFVINDLLSAWKSESEKLKSPYFDYNAKAVSELLVQFQNALSNHILISKADFLPLLKQATNKTLLLILAPYDFYADFLDQKGQALSTAALRNFVKYVKINKPPLEKLLAHLESRNKETLLGKEAFALLDHILEEVNFTPEDIEPYLLHFNKMVPLSVEKFYEASATKKPEVKTPPQPKVEPLIKPLVVVETKSVPTVADDLARKKVVRLKESLTINQKFMFTKILFHGDFEIFTEAIDRIDKLDNINQAMRFIDDGYPDWDRESEEYEEFIEILQKRFS